MNKHRPRQRSRECNESVINDVTAGLCNSRKCVTQLPSAQGSHCDFFVNALSMGYFTSDFRGW